tara:strand:+ start:180 stop:557 length:378 start_codon:yes stop_codon:yes gene_type:complete
MYGKILLIVGLFSLVSGCSNNEPPRDVKDVSSKNSKTIFEPRITKSRSGILEISYAQITMGSDVGCLASQYESYSTKVNQCAKLPEKVKSMAIDHCEGYDKKAVFLGNRTNFLKMTVSKFRCEIN